LLGQKRVEEENSLLAGDSKKNRGETEAPIDSSKRRRSWSNLHGSRKISLDKRSRDFYGKKKGEVKTATLGEQNTLETRTRPPRDKSPGKGEDDRGQKSWGKKDKTRL